MEEQKKEVTSLNENTVTQNGQKPKPTDKKKKVKKLSERSRYFDFYDDVKAGCHKIIDW